MNGTGLWLLWQQEMLRYHVNESKHDCQHCHVASCDVASVCSSHEAVYTGRFSCTIVGCRNITPKIIIKKLFTGHLLETKYHHSVIVCVYIVLPLFTDKCYIWSLADCVWYCLLTWWNQWSGSLFITSASTPLSTAEGSITLSQLVTKCSIYQWTE